MARRKPALESGCAQAEAIAARYRGHPDRIKAQALGFLPQRVGQGWIRSGSWLVQSSA